MEIVATLVDKPESVYDILDSVPRDSVVLLPEGATIGWGKWDTYVKHEVMAEIARRRGLFVVANKSTTENGSRYNTMIGYEKGLPVWRVRKYFLWDDETDSIDSPPRPEPMVTIRGKKVGVAICYELSKVAGFGRLFAIGRILAENQAELLLMPAHWQFFWALPMFVSDTVVKIIPSIIGGGFSSSNLKDLKSYAMVFKRGHNGSAEFKRTHERNSWVSLEF